MNSVCRSFISQYKLLTNDSLSFVISLTCPTLTYEFPNIIFYTRPAKFPFMLLIILCISAWLHVGCWWFCCHHCVFVLFFVKYVRVVRTTPSSFVFLYHHFNKKLGFNLFYNTHRF